MKKSSKLIIGIAIVIIILAIIFLILRSSEDDWIKDSRGVWIKHGNPDQTKTPNYVTQQQALIQNVTDLYNSKKQEMNFSSQCLGTIEDYAIDIVHVPRANEDDNTENQCPAFLNKTVGYFVELDKDGNIIRIA
ncbi:MAG: hypothetical protein WC796_02990 [Candidatus Pacearchaeota archaeon]|jgi:hypothetical protein